jgi:hypothetical protein
MSVIYPLGTDQTSTIGEIAGIVFNFAYTLWAAYIYEFISRNTYYQELLLEAQVRVCCAAYAV